MFEYAYYAYFTHVITFWLFGSIFIFFDSQIEKKKSFKKISLERKSINWNFYRETAIDVLKNHILIVLPFNLIISPLWEYFGSTWDSIHYSLLDITVILLIEELLFFYIHYMFHKQRYLYKNIHYKHHKWVQPEAISALYAHPIELIICNYMPLLIGFFITKFNFYGALIMIVIGTLNALYVHSGYNFIIGKKPTHYQHHMIYNKQYGVLGILDRIHKTN